MNEAGQTLQLYVKPSHDRPWRDRRGTLTAPGLELTTLGTIIKGPVPCRALRDGTGQWRRLSAIHEYLGQARRGLARAYLVDTPRGREVWVLGGQLGLWWRGAARPLLWIEGGMADLPQDVAKGLGLVAG